MTKATDELVKTHRVVWKVLDGFAADKPRFSEIVKTLHRTVLAHAWLQDEIFLGTLVGKPLIDKGLVDEITQEHRDLDHLLQLLENTSADRTAEVGAFVLQIRVILQAHFKKEVEALYPLAEKVVDSQTLNKAGNEMKRRQTEVRDVVQN